MGGPEQVQHVRERVRRLIADRHGSVTTDRAGDFVIEHGRVPVYVCVTDDTAAADTGVNDAAERQP